MCLATMACIYTQHVQLSVTIFSTGGKFQPVSKFIELHTLALATHSYELLTHGAIPGEAL